MDNLWCISLQVSSSLLYVFRDFAPGSMRVLILVMLTGCCMASSVIHTPVFISGQPWTAYTFTQNSAPAVVRIAGPDIKFALPQYPTVVSSQAITSVKSAAPVPLFRSITPVAAAPAPVVAAPVPVAPAPIPVLKTVSPPAPAIASVTPVVVATAPEPLQAPEPPLPSVGTPFVGGQFRSQDETGQYTFGHWGGPNTRVESRDAFGRTSGSFAYVDPVGEVQVRKYAAGPASGFRVAASDLPVDNPEVAQVKAAHAQAIAAVKSLGSSAAIHA